MMVRCERQMELESLFPVSIAGDCPVPSDDRGSLKFLWIKVTKAKPRREVMWGLN